MATVPVVDGDTWDSIAAANSADKDDLLTANGYVAGSTPDPPATGSTVFLPPAPPPVAVAPDHAHAVDVGEEKSLWIQLEMTPEDATACDGSLRVYTSDGTYDVTVAISGNYVLSGDTVDMVFHGMDPSASFAMDYLDGDGTARTLFTETAYADIAAAAPGSTT